MNDGILEVESREIVSNSDTIGNGKVPVVPESFSVVQNDSLTEMMRSVANKLEAMSKRFSVRDRLLIPATTPSVPTRQIRKSHVHVKDPIVDSERNVISEVVERSSLVLGFT